MQLELLNLTELCELIRQRLGFIMKRSTPKERLIQIITHGYQANVSADEISGSTKTRHLLQQFIEKNWIQLNSQIPCKGENRGKCTIYPCPEGRHFSCFHYALPQVRAMFGGTVDET